MTCEVCKPTDPAWHDPYTGRSVRKIKADQDQGHCENCWGPIPRYSSKVKV